MIVKNLEKKEKSTVSFEVVCDAAEFEKAVNAAYLKNKKNIFVQGFRKGKAPRMVIEGMYGKDVFYEDATDELAPAAFEYAVAQEGLRNVGQPAVSKVDISAEKELTLTFITAVWPEVTLGQYKGLEAPKAEEAAEDVVEETILAAKPSWQPPKPKSERRERNRRSRSANRLQEGDEVLIESSKPRPAPKHVEVTPAAEDGFNTFNQDDFTYEAPKTENTEDRGDAYVAKEDKE